MMGRCRNESRWYEGVVSYSFREISFVFPDTVKLSGCLDVLSVVCARTGVDTADALRGLCLLSFARSDQKMEFSMSVICLSLALYFHLV